MTQLGAAAVTRGERNNNPCNIRKTGAHWFGAAPAQLDDDFVQFQHAEYGLRAAAKILQQYAGRGIDTPTSIISTWAPPSENDDKAYIDDFCTRTGFAPDQKLALDDPAVLASVLRGLVWHENGKQPYDDGTITTGVRLALAVA